MPSYPQIAILGAAGITGRALVDTLHARGCRPRAMVRNPDRAAPFEGADIVAGDLGDPASLLAALEGVDIVHLIPPVFDDRESDYAANLLQAAQAAGVSRISYHSVLHAPTPAMPHHRRKSLVELMLRESDATWTILQPAMYVRTPLIFLDRAAGTLSPPFDPGRRFNPIDLADLAEAVANTLLEPGHEFATYELAGTDRLDFHQMAAAISAVTGQAVTVERQDLEERARARAKGRGFDERQTEELVAMFRHYDEYGLLGNGNVLAMLLGRPPRSFEESVRIEIPA